MLIGCLNTVHASVGLELRNVKRNLFLSFQQQIVSLFDCTPLSHSRYWWSVRLRTTYGQVPCLHVAPERSIQCNSMTRPSYLPSSRRWVFVLTPTGHISCLDASATVGWCRLRFHWPLTLRLESMQQYERVHDDLCGVLSLDPKRSRRFAPIRRT